MPSRTEFVHRIESAAPALLASRALFCAVGVRVVNRSIGVSSAGARFLCLDLCELRVLLPTLQYASALSVWLVHGEPEHDLREHVIALVVAAVRKMPRLQWLTIGADRTSMQSAIDAGLRAICYARSGLALRTLELLPPPTPETARMLAAACDGALETYRCAYAGDARAWAAEQTRAFLALCPRMRDLDVPGAWRFISVAEIEGAARLCPRLRRLRLECAAMSSAEAAQLLSLLPVLEELEVVGVFENSVFRAASRFVRKASLINAGNGAPASLAEHCPDVSAHCHALEDRNVPHCCPALTRQRGIAAVERLLPDEGGLRGAIEGAAVKRHVIGRVTPWKIVVDATTSTHIPLPRRASRANHRVSEFGIRRSTRSRPERVCGRSGPRGGVEGSGCRLGSLFSLCIEWTATASAWRMRCAACNSSGCADMWGSDMASACTAPRVRCAT